MKIVLNQKTAQKGTALLITLTTAVVFGIVIGTALTMVSSQNKAVARSQAWNNCIPVAEAGIEEALAQYMLYKSNLTANGWSQSGSAYTLSRTFADSNRFTVKLQDSTPPMITSTGWVKVPFSASDMIHRVVRVTLTNTATFTKALVSLNSVELKGNYVVVDSFDSSTSTGSTGGRWDLTKRRDNGDVASILGVTDILNIGNADIYGSLHTGAGGSASIGSQGSVGTENWINWGNKGIQSGHFADDMNVSFPDVLPPYTSGWTPSPGTIGGTNYDYVLTNAPPNTNYYLSSFNSNSKIYVGTNAILYVAGGDVTMGDIMINTNSVLKFYHGSSNPALNQSVGLKGNTSVNSSGKANSLQYYGLPSVKSVTLNGNQGYTGTIYAPEAAFTLNGSGSTVYDVSGSAIVGSVKFNGHFNFHYDESLNKTGPAGLPILQSWIEL